MPNQLLRAGGSGDRALVYDWNQYGNPNLPSGAFARQLYEQRINELNMYLDRPHLLDRNIYGYLTDGMGTGDHSEVGKSLGGKGHMVQGQFQSKIQGRIFHDIVQHCLHLK